MILESRCKAVETLIQDEDPQTRRLLIQELVSSFSRNRQLLDQLITSSCPDTRSFAREVMERCGQSCSGQADGRKQLAGQNQKSCFCDDIPRPQIWEHLEVFCWWLTRQEYPCFDSEVGSRHLDEWAERVHEISPGSECAEDRVRYLRAVLAHEVGLRGDFCDYYSPENSYLNRVIERKRGIPISLSLIYIFVGHRVGWKVRGLNMPGHFLACVDNVVFDPFFNGKILSSHELKKRFFLPECEFENMEGFHAEPLEVAHRILANLRNSYTRCGNAVKLRRISDCLYSLSESA